MPPEPLRYLALGDSYSIGEGVTEAERWPVVLAARLGEAGIAIAPPRIIAATGWTTDELAAAMDAAEPLGHWDLVSLLIGVNNQYRGRPLVQFRSEFAALLERAIALAGGRPARTFVLAIPDWGVTPFAEGRERARIAAELDAFNAVKQAVCAEREVAFVDISGISRRADANPDWLAGDGLHPGAAQYRAWVALALPALRALLSPGD
ncbi:MAG: SGNH/GDSL hydrolase family protein [Lysobacteraceae bacterium]